MQSSAWVALLRHIPSEQQHQFMLVTVSGTEIAVQSFLRIESDLVVIKGRLSGTQDSGRVFFIPYRQIDYFGYSHPVKDVDFNELFDSLTFPDAEYVPESPPTPVIATAPVPAPAPAPAPPQPAAPASAQADSTARPIRSEVLERFRSRPTSSPALPNPTKPK